MTVRKKTPMMRPAAVKWAWVLPMGKEEAPWEFCRLPGTGAVCCGRW